MFIYSGAVHRLALLEFRLRIPNQILRNHNIHLIMGYITSPTTAKCYHGQIPCYNWVDPLRCIFVLTECEHCKQFIQIIDQVRIFDITFWLVSQVRRLVSDRELWHFIIVFFEIISLFPASTTLLLSRHS